MTFRISLQGGMASGKTTLAKYIDSSLNDVKVSYEDTLTIINEVKRLGLNKFILEDFIEIQRLFINSEIERYNNLKSFDKVIIDLGPEEIEFYTLFFPSSIGQNWDMEILLKDELYQLRQCSLDGILYLDTDSEVLYYRKEKDRTRARGFFNHYINGLHTYKKQWFAQFNNISFLNVNNMSIDEVGSFAIEWLENF